MATISAVCENLFTSTNLAKLERKPVRGLRRNLARLVYRQGRRPGLVNPQAEPGPAPMRLKPTPVSRGPRPLRHVYKFHEPARAKPDTFRAKLRMHMVPKFARKAVR